MDKHTTGKTITTMDERQLQIFVTTLASNLDDVDTAMVFMNWLVDHHPDDNLSRQVLELIQSLNDKDPDIRKTMVFRIVGLFLEPCERCLKLTEEKELYEDEEWKSEPSYDRWVHQGVPCLIHWGGMGYCGYIGVPSGHSLYQQSNDSEEDFLSVHGGITFTGEDCYQGNQHRAYAPLYANQPHWWIGWDYMHAGDWVPRMNFLPARHYDDLNHRWAFNEVKTEVNQAAEQLAQLKVSQ